MLVTTVLTAVLLAALLSVTSGISRDRQRLAAADGDGRPGSGGGRGLVGRPEPLMDLLRRDLANARTLGRSADGRGVVLEGHGGLNRASLVPTGRLTRVTYRVRPAGGAGRGAGGGGGGPPCLVREQQYLDDPARPEPWADVVAVGVRRFRLAATAAGGGLAGDTLPGDEPDDDATDDKTPEAGSLRTNGGASPVPSSIWVRVEFDAGAVDELLRVR